MYEAIAASVKCASNMCLPIHTTSRFLKVRSSKIEMNECQGTAIFEPSVQWLFFCSCSIWSCQTPNCQMDSWLNVGMKL